MKTSGLAAKSADTAPFQVGQPVGRLLTAAPINWDTIRAEQAAYEAQQQAASPVPPGYLRLDDAQRRDQPARHRQRHDRNPRQSRRHPARITYQTSSTSVSTRWPACQQTAVTYNGEPVPLAISGGPTIGPDTVIEFIGHARAGLYSDTNIYALTLDRSAAARVDIDNRPAQRHTGSQVTWRSSASRKTTNTFPRVLTATRGQTP